LDFLLQLEKYKDILQPEEYLHLAARENIKGKSLQFLRDYITCGPPEEKEQMIQKLRRSARVEAGEEEYDGQDCAWEYGENNDSDERTDEEFDTVGCDKTIEDGKLFGGDVSPKATAGEVLDMIDEIFPVSDKSLSDYFVDHLVARIWNHAYRSENAALAQVQAFQGREFPTIVKNRFETEYNRTKSIPMPKGYKMRKNGKKVKPRLMQWHIAQKVMDEKAVGNWSGTGSGKTLSAILSAMVIGARTTVIFCPTQVKETWVNAIKESFSGCEIKVEDFNPKWKQSHRRFLIFGYGKIQSVARSKFHAFIERLDQVDLMVVDEIQYVKQRKVYEQDGDREKEEAENEKLISNRRSMVLYIAKIMSDKNANMAILGMSATPVVNNLQEGKSILDIIVAGKGGLEEINTKGKPTRDKCMAMHRQFVHVGTRYMQHPGVEIKIRDDVTVNIDDGPYMENLYEVKRRGWKPTDVANVLTTARIPKILEELRAGTIVYTEHVRGVVSKLRNAIQDDGWRVGSYTGGDKRGDYDGLHRFKRGEIDVLIASKSISTGIDGIQDVCHRIVMNEIPWTAAEFDQITGRVWRSGQEEPVEIVIILSEGTQRTGDPWSMDRVRLNRINYKREIADAVLDGVYPESNLISPQKAFRLMGEWLKDVSEGNVIEPVIREIEIPFIPRDDEERALQRNHGDVSRTNKRWNKMHSSELHEELTADPRIWEIYHTARDAEMKDWSIVPTEYLAGLCKHRPGRVVGDFGCGTAYLAEALKGHCKVHSFDHVAINDDVVACDMRHTPLEDGVLDIAIFSLSLTGINWREYLDEARRTLKIDGFLWIVEPSISKKIYRSDKLRSFETLLKKKGFAPFKITTEGQFTFLCYVKE
jgi:superfamily II DNA or RNA helicase